MTPAQERMLLVDGAMIDFCQRQALAEGAAGNEVAKQWWIRERQHHELACEHWRKMSLGSAGASPSQGKEDAS